MNTIKSINPCTGDLMKEYPEMNNEQIESIISKAHEAFLKWKDLSFETRAGYMRKAAQIMLKKKQEISEVCAREMGKPTVFGDGETDVCAMILNYYADNAEKFLADRPLETSLNKAFIAYEPLGVILSVQPWNAPFYQMIRSAGPHIMAGNTMIMKQASNVPQCAQLMEDIFNEAGFPQGVYTNLFLEGSKVTPLLDDYRIQGATLTGSIGAGASFAAAASKNIVRSILELGGNDPCIIMNDADLDEAFSAVIMGRIWNAGQICCSPKRIIISEDIYEQFVTKAKETFESIKIGNPLDKDTVLGPLCTEEALKKALSQINTAIKQGVTVITGGKRLEREGFFLEPTILTDITNDMDIYHEEVFAPVLMVYKFKNIDEAIDLANDSTYGLGGSIFSKNEEEAVKLARKINTGMVFINHVTTSVGPELPFGGTKKSGYGRELSPDAIYEFVNPKLIRITNTKALY